MNWFDVIDEMLEYQHKKHFITEHDKKILSRFSKIYLKDYLNTKPISVKEINETRSTRFKHML